MVFEVQNVVGTTGIVANMLLSIEENSSAEARAGPSLPASSCQCSTEASTVWRPLWLQLLPKLSPRNAHLPSESQG